MSAFPNTPTVELPLHVLRDVEAALDEIERIPAADAALPSIRDSHIIRARAKATRALNAIDRHLDAERTAS